MKETRIGGDQAAFQPTLWTQVLKARTRSSPEGRAALDRLLAAYWKPIYFFIRRRGRNVEDAKDLTQEFFARFLEREALKGVDPSKGKFRTFLLAVLEHLLSDEYDRRKAKKRTPRFDFAKAETQFRPDHSFERDWALAVFERAFVRLREEDPRGAETLKRMRGYANIAEKLDTTEGNVKVIAHRAKKRLRQLLLEEIRPTVADDSDEKTELAEILRALSL